VPDDTTRADAMLNEMSEQRNQMANRAALLAAELAEAKKENEKLQKQIAELDGKKPEPKRTGV
jgi:outer membrane PBP1 activator LpoA protein